MPEENVKDLYLSSDAVRRLIELLIDEIHDHMPAITTVLPMTADEANSADMKDKVPTVLAVFNALASIDHIKFRLMKGKPGQSFEDYMTEQQKSPEELALYFYRTTDVGKFDLWIYDASFGYTRVGSESIQAGDIDLADYWSKEELDINAYWSKEELKLEDFVTADVLKDYVKTVDLDDYLRKDDIGTMTEQQIEDIFNEVKNAGATTE